MEHKILTILEQYGFHGLNLSQIIRYLNDDSIEFVDIIKCMNQLIERYEVIEDESHQYYLLSNSPYMIGVLRINDRGFGFVEDGDDSIYVHKNNIHQAMEKDKVLIRIWNYEDGSREGEIKQIIKRANQKIVGTYKKKDGKTYFLPDVNLHNRKIKLLNIDEFHLVHDQKLLVEVVNFKDVLEANIVKVLGHKYDPGMDILSILLTHDIEPAFSDVVMNEVKEIPDHVSFLEFEGRKDLRNELIITIDGDDARDLDDAISVKKTKKGYLLGVHIADVSHYVKAHSAIDEEAYKRGTSVYVIDRVVPMLPQALSNGICSLLAKVDRFTITCEMEIDKSGEILEYQIYPSIIRSSAQMTYRKVNAILEGDPKLQKEYSWLFGMLKDMFLLSHIIRKKRVQGGAIDFDVKEGKILVDEKGDPYRVEVRERKEAERMIEDFMIQANICVARHMKWMDLPSMYRIHETPDLKKMRSFQQTATIMGHKLKGNLADLHPMQLQQYLDSLKDQEDYEVLCALLLRSMQKAKYDVACKGHFGLALDDYTHFTSPIRRYPDLMVHRYLRKYFFQQDYRVEEMQKDVKWLEECADHSSKQERNAIEAEREVDDYKKAQYMEKHIGQIYIGQIRSVMKFGMFVELDNTVEGLIHVSSMQDDYYIFDEVGKSFYGTHTKKVYKMGQRVKIKVVDASRYKQQVDFVLVEENKNEKGGKRNRNRSSNDFIHERLYQGRRKKRKASQGKGITKNRSKKRRY